MKTIRLTGALLALIVLLGGMSAVQGEENVTAYEAYLAGGEAPCLAKRYEGIFTVGAAVSPAVLKDERAAALIAAHFNSLTCENQMKAEAVLDRSASIRSKDNTRAKLNFSNAGPVLSFAQAHGMRVRAHTLVWHSQTPRWFFAENWSNMPNAPLVDRDTMLLRLENYIRDEMAYVNGK